jgi:hypothetical protein
MRERDRVRKEREIKMDGENGKEPLKLAGGGSVIGLIS